MKSIFSFFVVLLFVFLFLSFATNLRAELHSRGSGLVYDDVLSITWLQDANYFGGTKTWDEAMSLADSFVFEGYDDWRLPKTDISCLSNGCITSEMTNLFYGHGVNSESWGPFDDVRPFHYWSSAESGSEAWRFNFNVSGGYYGTSSKEYGRYAWFVRDGDSVSIIPEPMSSLLFLVGGLTLAFRRFRKKRQ